MKNPQIEKTLNLGVSVETGAPFLIPLTGAATKTLGIFGKKGSGKTWTSAVWVEQLLTNKIPVVILDPVGRWWDLGLSAPDGRSPGFPVAIFGGQHGQVQLTPDMGAAIARYVVEKHVPTVIDLSFERKGTWRRVVADFCDELFKVNVLPVHVVIEEAPEFIPQRIFGDMATVFGAVDRLVRLGRNRGIGVTAIGQRLQTTNKDTVSQVDALIVMRLVDPQGRKAALEWVKAKGQEEQAQEFVDALSGLKNGEGYIWSPEWLETFERVRFAPRVTFHFDADRAAVESLPTGEIAQAVNTDDLLREFSKFVEPSPAPLASKGKSDAATIKHIGELNRQIESLNSALETAQAQAITDAEIDHRIEIAVQNSTSEMRSRLAQFEGYVSNIVKQGQALVNGSTVAASSILESGAAPQKVAEYIAKQNAIFNNLTVSKILRTLGENHLRFLNGMTSTQIATESGYDPQGGRFKGTLRTLSKRRVIVKEGDRYLLNPAHLK